MPDRCRWGIRWNAQTGYLGRRAGSTGHQCRLAAYHGTGTKKVVGTAYQQFCLFFKGHCLHYFVDVVDT